MSSQFEKFPEKNLRLILRVISEVVYDRDLVTYSNVRDMKSKLEDLGFQPSNMDYEFLFELMRLNPNFETEKIEMPSLHDYEITFERQVVKYSTEYWEKDVESYLSDKDDVKSFVHEMGRVEWWSGDMVDEDYGYQYLGHKQN